MAPQHGGRREPAPRRPFRRAGFVPAAAFVVRAFALSVLFLFVGLAPGGCDAGNPGPTIAFADEGRLCVFPADGRPASPFDTPTDPVSFPADRGLELRIVMPTCLSSSCSRDVMASCKAGVLGDAVTVHSVASYRQQGTSCTTDCGALVANCAVQALTAGAYTIRHGATELTLTLPSTAPPPCGGTGLGGD